MKRLLLLLSLLALGTLGLSACGGGGNDQTAAAAETETTNDHDTGQQLAADNKQCGVVLDRWTLAVAQGDTSCRAARRRVMHDWSTTGSRSAVTGCAADRTATCRAPVTRRRQQGL